MNLEDVYKEIKCPFVNIGLIKTMISVYLKTNNFKDFYEKVIYYTSIKNSQVEQEEFGEASLKKFAMLIYNLWKYSILNTPIEKVPMIKYNNEPTKYLEIKNRLKQEGYDIEQLFISELENNSCLHYSTEWTFLNSYYINIPQVTKIKKEHVLYLNINSKSGVFRILKVFIETCVKQNLPYDIKFANNINRSNNVIIYSNNEYLDKYISILKYIIDDAELKLLLSRPALLSGSIYNFIGYESRQYVNEEDFTIERLRYIYDILDKFVPNLYDEFFKENISDYKDVTYEQYIIDEINSSLDSQLSFKEKNGAIDFIVSVKINKAINKFKTFKYSKLEDIIVKISKNEYLEYKKDKVIDLIDSLILSIFRKYPEKLNELKFEINSLFEQNGIDSITACISINTLNSMFEFDKFNKNNMGAIIIPVSEKEKFDLTIVPTKGKLNYFIAPNNKIYPSKENYLNSIQKGVQKKK